MTKVTIDATTAALLATVHGEVQICDSSGNILGWYAPVVPSSSQPTRQELIDSCPTSEEELQRRIREEKDSGRSWADIRRELGSM